MIYNEELKSNSRKSFENFKEEVNRYAIGSAGRSPALRDTEIFSLTAEWMVNMSVAFRKLALSFYYSIQRRVYPSVRNENSKVIG